MSVETMRELQAYGFYIMLIAMVLMVLMVYIMIMLMIDFQLLTIQWPLKIILIIMPVVSI